MKKINKMIVAMLLAVVLFSSNTILGFAENEERATIIGEDVVAAPGETVPVTINLTNNPGIIAMKLMISFDTELLTLTNVIDADVLGTEYHKPEKVSPYTLSWGMDTALENCKANGTVVTLEFSVAKDVEYGTKIPIEIFYDLDNYDICDFDGNKVEFAVENGSITIGGVSENPIEDFSYELSGDELTITEYIGTAKKVLIDSVYVIEGKEYTVVSIAEGAFEANTNITKVTIPETVIMIGDYAFYECTSLTDVVIYSKDITIGECALGYYYISRKEDGVVEGFTLTGYPETDVEAYASAEEKITFVPLVWDSEETPSQIVRKGQTLEYKNVIYVKVMYDLVDIDFSKVDISKDAGMLCWTEEEFYVLEKIEFDEEHALVGLEPYAGTSYYYGKSEGIYTRYLAEEMYYVGYVKLEDGTYIYSEPQLYGPTTYAYNMINKPTTSAKTKQLCVALLNYITAAQKYFYEDVTPEELANRNLTEEQKQVEWDINALDFNLAGEVPGDKIVEQDVNVFKKIGKNLRFQEMISLISIYQIEESYINNAEECGTIFWTAEEFAQLEGRPSADNYGKGQKIQIETYGSKNMWCSVAPAVAAKDMKDTSYYILGYIKHSDGTVSYSGVISYSFEQYIYNTVTGTSASQKMVDFAKMLYIYERSVNEALK